MSSESGQESIPRRVWVAIPLIVVIFISVGFILERLPALDQGRLALRGHSGPGGLPDTGAVANLLEGSADWMGARGVLSGDLSRVPSTLVMSEDQLDAALPTLSIVADEDALFDPLTGIIANRRAKGRDWERLSWVSLWENGELLVASRAGLRVHGDSARSTPETLSFRLHFRPRYGTSAALGARLLGGQIDAAPAVVVRVVRPPNAFANTFSFDIARQVGSIVPRYRLARTYLNGSERGIFLLTEHVAPDGFGLTIFGHPDFYMFIPKGDVAPDSFEAYQILEAWVLEHDSLTMDEAAARIDVENLTRHLFTLMFCFATDWAQGAVMYDRTDPDARWFWAHWDMDLSFGARGDKEMDPWSLPVLELVTLEGATEDLQRMGVLSDQRHIRRHQNDLRRLLFLRLLEDSEYRNYFVRLATDLLNHKLTSEYLGALLESRRGLSRRGGNFGRLDLRDYFEHRPDFMRSELARYFELEPGVEVTVAAQASAGAQPIDYQIDGFAESGPYSGVYFPGQTISVEITGEARSRLSHWLVDGERVQDSTLEITVVAPTLIQPVFAQGEPRRP